MATSTQPRRGTSALALFAFLILGLVLGGAVFYGISRITFVQDDLPEMNSSTISASFEDIAELSVEEYQFTNVGRYDNEGYKAFGFSVPFTGKNFLITYDGTVKAGVRDLTQAGITVNNNARKISVRMPQVTVNETNIDPKSVTVYDQSMNPFNQVKVQDMTGFMAAEREASEKKAIEQGLLDRAEGRVEELVTSHIEALTKGTAQEDYSVEFTWK